MRTLPSGTVTLLLTDIEDSTALYERHREAMASAVARHERLLADVIAACGGELLKPRGEGDSTFSVFAQASQALAAACAAQLALHHEAWPDGLPLRVRMAIHIGEAELRDGDYFGPVVNRCARVRSLAHGGQTLLTEAVVRMVEGELPGGVSLRALGRYRLRGIERPEELSQLVHPALPDDFPPLRSPDRLPNNLPHVATRFIGRQPETEHLRALVAANPLVTIVGPGGNGKTRLALQAASSFVDDDAHQGGVWFVDLAAVREGSGLLPQVAAALQARDVAGRPLLGTVLDQLGTDACVLILDNCEHVLAEAGAFSIAALETCERLRIVVTSREPLGVAGEYPYLLPSLSMPPGVGTIGAAQAGRSDAVALFVDRATRARPQFALSNDNAAAVADICARLSGNPLAIELAAAHVRLLSLEQITARLQQPLGLLAGGPMTVASRHQSIRESIQWSYDLLDAPERVLLQRLAVFAGGFGIEDAETVTSAPPVAHDDVLGVLTHLVLKSLVGVDDEASDERRFRLLEPVRAFADERLREAGEREAMLARHAEHYTTLAIAAAPDLTGPRQAQWLRRLTTELDNLRAALAWCSASGDAATGLRLASSLWRFWYIRGHWSEGLSFLERLLAHVPVDLDAVLHGDALHAAGTLAALLNQRALAEDRLNAAIDLRRALGDRQGEANSLTNLGIAATQRGDFAAARPYYEASLAIRRELGDKWGIAATLTNLVESSLRLADLARARAQADESVQMFTAIGDGWALSAALVNRGRISYYQGDYSGARAALNRSIELRGPLGDASHVAECRIHLAETELHAGDMAAVTAICQSIVDDAVVSHDAQVNASALLLLGKIALIRQSLSEACEYLAKAHALALTSGDDSLLAAIRDYQGLSACFAGRIGEARSLFLQALETRTAIGDFRISTLESVEHFGLLAALTGRSQRARRLSSIVGTIRRQMDVTPPPLLIAAKGMLQGARGADPDSMPSETPKEGPLLEDVVAEILSMDWG